MDILYGTIVASVVVGVSIPLWWMERSAKREYQRRVAAQPCPRRARITTRP